MKQHYFEVCCDHDDRALKVILAAWCELQIKFSVVEGEPAYDQSEAANTSLLVAAANLQPNWVGIAEYYVERELADSKHRGRGSLDAYLATENQGYLFEIKQQWMTTARNQGARLRYDGGNKLKKAEQQVRQLMHENGFAKDTVEFCSFFGGFLISAYEITEDQIHRRAAFEELVSFCRENFQTYAAVSPGLKRSRLSRTNWNSYRPAAAIVLRRFDSRSLQGQ